MMDCDTTGIEPDIALIKYKKLVGEGFLKIVNQTVPEALTKLGYNAEQVAAIIKYIDEQETIEGAPGLKDEHLSVFDCAFKAKNGQRSIQYMGHVRMMAAAQPFLSGAISKTVNMPEAATAAEIESVYLEGWKLGLKAIAVYRDGSKRSQPLSTSKKKDEPAASNSVLSGTGVTRRRLPVERTAITHRFDIGGQEGYLTVGLYEDGQPGEIFLKMAKEGSTVSGLVDTFATTVSVALQYGVPLRDLVNKFAHVRFEPSGFTGNAEIPIAKSIVDYVFRYLGSRFLPESDRAALGLQERADGGPVLGSLPSTVRVGAAAESCGPDCTCGKGGGVATATTSAPVELKAATPAKAAAAAAPATSGAGQVLASAGLGFQNQSDAPSCPECGAIMVRNAACYKCMTCGTTSGCS
jgi:ribonucleoside-diphosphate reductase alpha chain